MQLSTRFSLFYNVFLGKELFFLNIYVGFFEKMSQPANGTRPGLGAKKELFKLYLYSLMYHLNN